MCFMNKFEFLVDLYNRTAITTSIQFMFLIKNNSSSVRISVKKKIKFTSNPNNQHIIVISQYL